MKRSMYVGLGALALAVGCWHLLASSALDELERDRLRRSMLPHVSLTPTPTLTPAPTPQVQQSQTVVAPLVLDMSNSTLPCPRCNGTGVCVCPDCGGTGYHSAGYINGQPAAYGCTTCSGIAGNPMVGGGACGTGHVPCPCCGGSKVFTLTRADPYSVRQIARRVNDADQECRDHCNERVATLARKIWGYGGFQGRNVAAIVPMMHEARNGWIRITAERRSTTDDRREIFREAQERANQGYLVVVAYVGGGSNHVALVIPDGGAAMQESRNYGGLPIPFISQAGHINGQPNCLFDQRLSAGFGPELSTHLLFYYHDP